MTNNFRIHASELKAVLETAYAMKKQKENQSFSIQEIAETVEEYGIQAEDLVEAHQNLQAKKRQNKQQKSKIVFYVAFFICLIVSFIHKFYPKKFIGNLDMILTTEVTPYGTPLDERKSFQIFQQNKMYAVMRFHSILAPYQIRWEIRDSNQKLIATDTKNLIRSQNIQMIIASCNLSFANAVGDYSLQVFADDQLIKEEQFEVEYGHILTALHGENTPNETSIYSKSETQKINFRVNQSNLIHSGALEWRWFAPDGSTQKHTIQKVCAGLPWQFSDEFETDNQEVGNYRVELLFRNAKIDERHFELIN